MLLDNMCLLTFRFLIVFFLLLMPGTLRFRDIPIFNKFGGKLVSKFGRGHAFHSFRNDIKTFFR